VKQMKLITYALVMKGQYMKGCRKITAAL